MNIADKLAIHDLLGRVAYALDERMVEDLQACFAPDAVLNLRIAGVDDEPRFTGREAIMGLMTASMEEQTDQRRHLTTNIMFVEEDDVNASVISNLTITAVEDGTIRLVTSGLYRDKVRKEDGTWVITERCIELDMGY